MQVFQEIAKDKYGATYANVDLTVCFNVFLTEEQIKAQYHDRAISSYYFTPNTFPQFIDKVDSDSIIALCTSFIMEDGAQVRYIKLEALMKDAVAGLADGQKLWKFDMEVISRYDTHMLMTYNTYFKQFGVQYSIAKGGFVPSKPQTDKKIPVGIINGIKRSFVNECVSKLKRKAPGVVLDVEQRTNGQTEAGCKLMKALGYTLNDLVIVDHNVSPPIAFEGLKASIAHVSFKAKLSDKQTKELLKIITDWWSSL